MSTNPATALSTEPAPWEDAPSLSNAEDPNRFSEFDSFDVELDDSAPLPPEKAPLVDEIAAEFVGFWNVLVSKTNWEKGKVVHSWRAKLQEAGMPRSVYSDEALSQRIGNVSPQHVGRLRRVYERFGDKPVLPNLYWSHYQAALDWDDADEWLARASEEKSSVAQMRVARWEKNGAVLQSKPRAEEDYPTERDEDVNPLNDSNADAPMTSQETDANANPDENAPKKKKKNKAKNRESELGEYSGELEPWERDGSATEFTTGDVLNAIAQLDPLPTELAEPLEALKVAVLTRKIEGWPDAAPSQIAAHLSEIKRLLVAKDE